jgi:hypothetical protein
MYAGVKRANRVTRSRGNIQGNFQFCRELHLVGVVTSRQRFPCLVCSSSVRSGRRKEDRFDYCRLIVCLCQSTRRLSDVLTSTLIL